MRKDLDEIYRLGLYGNGIERIKLKKAVQIIQKASASQVKIVDIGHDNFDSACEALELGSVDMAVVDMAQLIRMEKNDENLPYGVVISGVLKRGDSRYVMIRKRHAKDLIENAVVATEFAFSVADSASLFAGFAAFASGFASAAGWVSDTPAG